MGRLVTAALQPVMARELFKPLKAERDWFEGRIGRLTPKVYGRFKAPNPSR